MPLDGTKSKTLEDFISSNYDSGEGSAIKVYNAVILVDDQKRGRTSSDARQEAEYAIRQKLEEILGSSIYIIGKYDACRKFCSCHDYYDVPCSCNGEGYCGTD